MPNTNDLLHQLAAQRTTLAQLLAHSGSADAVAAARVAIAQIEVQLHELGVTVEGEAGDIIDARDSQGFINRPTGPVTQHIYPRMPVPRPEIDLDQARQLLGQLPLDTIPEPTLGLPVGSRMPLLRNAGFVGRDTELRTLAAAITSNDVAAITTGIGGVGKTQLASEFAHRYGQFFAGGVFWLSFTDPAGIDSEIAACGGTGALELYADADELKQTEQVERVYAAWAQETPRLLIFDNCDDQAGVTGEALLTARLPRSGGCRVLVTSRRGQWSTGLHLATLALEVLERKASIVLLRSYRADLRDADADAIATEVGDLPLALTLVGSYLAAYRDEAFGVPATYLANLRKQLVLGHRSMEGKGAAPSLTNHDLNVRATFALSYERLNQDDPTDALAIAALARAACLAPGEPFPRDLLVAALGETTDDEEVAAQRADAIQRLVALGLLEGAAGGSLRMHRLIGAFARGVTEDKGAQGAVEEALTSAGNRLVNGGVPAQVQPLLAHLRHAMVIADQRGDSRAGSLANALGRTEAALINYAAAQPLYKRALAISEQALGPAHPDTATSLNNLALLLDSQGDYAAARPLFERALAITEQALGPTHPQTATSLNNLAGLLEVMGDYGVARPLYERALAVCEATLGSTHPQTATSLNNLAGLLEATGDYAAARPLYERALAVCEATLGSTHPQTATSLNNLAGLLEVMSDYAAARPLYERALAVCEATLGSTHPQTATSLNNLAGLLEATGDYAAARPLYERALTIRVTILGSTHPQTATSLNNLAGLLVAVEDYEAAQPLYEQALVINETSFGASYLQTATILNNLAVMYAHQKRFVESADFMRRALTIRQQFLGVDHPDIQSSEQNLLHIEQQLAESEGFASHEAQIAQVTQRIEAAAAAAIAQALLSGNTAQRLVLAKRIDSVVTQIEQGKLSDMLIPLVAHLRMLKTQLETHEPPA